MDRRDHWQRVYEEKDSEKVSWYRPHLDTSLEWIEAGGVPASARIIDVGGGAATLVDDLLERGFESITVLDVSAEALAVAKRRLGDRAAGATWIAGDVTEVDLGEASYDLWHDRAVLHFLTDEDDRRKYARALRRALAPSGHAILAAFAPHGPEKCSDLPVRRYDTADFVDLVGEGFTLRAETIETHVTPSGNEQPFAYCWLERALACIVATALTVFAAGCGGSTEPGSDATGDRTGPAPSPAIELVSPAAAGSTTPNLFATPDGGVLMSWLEPVGSGAGEAASTRRGRFALRFARLDGDSWSEPRTIAEGEDFFVNWADFPSIVESDGMLAAHWMVLNGGRGTSYDVHISRSTDGGESWDQPVVPHADATQTEHGFVSLVPEEGGGFTAIWLDGRNFAGRTEGTSPEMTLRATSFEGGGTQGPETLLDPRICECCQTSAAYAGDTLLAVYRDRSDEEIRDIWSVRRTANGWQDPVRVAEDNWQIPGCPVNGPAIAGREDSAAVAWFSLPGGVVEIKVTFTRDGGATFTDPILLDSSEAMGIDTGSPREVAGLADSSAGRTPIPLGRVDIVWVDDSRVAVSWLVARGNEADIVLQTVETDGTLGRRHIIATSTSSRSGGFPRLVRSGDRLIVAWTEPDGTPSLKTAVVGLPIE